MFAVAVACTVAFADPRPPRWAADLASPRFPVRTAAADALERAGAAALPALLLASHSADPETATRADELLARIGRRLAADRLLAPTLVRLPPGPLTVAEAAAAVAAQTGYAVELTDPASAGKPVLPPAGPLPAWAAVQAVCAAAGLEVAAVAPRGPARPPETDVDRKLKRFQADADDAFEQMLHRTAYDLDVARSRARSLIDPDERERQTAEVRRREDSFQLVLRYAAERATKRELAKPAAADPDPHPTGKLTLRPTTLPPAVAVVGGVRVECRAATAAFTPGIPADQVAVLLRVRPEPRRTVERVDGVWVRRAVAADRELGRGPDGGAGGLVRLLPVRDGHIRLAADGRATLSDAPLGQAVGVCRPTEAVVRLTAWEPVPDRRPLAACGGGLLAVRPPHWPAPPDRLSELFGTVRAVVREDPAELLAVTVPGTAAVPGLRLTAAKPVAGDDGQFTLDVTVGYDPAGLRPAGGAGVRYDPDTGGGGFGRGGGWLRWNANQAAVTAARVAPTADGLTVRDAAGWPLAAVVVRVARGGGTAGRVADTLSLRVVPADGQGPPARVTFGGARAVPVDLPFALTDVPVAVGTAEAEPSP